MTSLDDDGLTLVRFERPTATGPATLTLNGEEVSKHVEGVEIHAAGGQPTGLTLWLAGTGGTVFEGYARVQVATPMPPGQAAAAFLDGISAAELEKTALHRPDLESGAHGLTKAMLATLIDWATGKDPNS